MGLWLNTANKIKTQSINLPGNINKPDGWVKVKKIQGVSYQNVQYFPGVISCLVLSRNSSFI